MTLPDWLEEFEQESHCHDAAKEILLDITLTAPSDISFASVSRDVWARDEVHYGRTLDLVNGGISRLGYTRGVHQWRKGP